MTGIEPSRFYFNLNFLGGLWMREVCPDLNPGQFNFLIYFFFALREWECLWTFINIICLLGVK